RSSESFLTFALPEPSYVAAIRIQCAAPLIRQPNLVRVAWKRANAPAYTSDFYTSTLPITPVTIAIADTIDDIRIYPNARDSYALYPSDFRVTKLQALLDAPRPVSHDPRFSHAEPLDQVVGLRGTDVDHREPRSPAPSPSSGP